MTRTVIQDTLDLQRRADFPLLRQQPELTYLDNAATVQKPQAVINAQRLWYEMTYSTVHRGMYDLAVQATSAYEGSREKIRSFINAEHASEIVFTPNATAALNLIAYIESKRLRAGDEILLSVAEHHSNILPWQRVAADTDAKLVWIALDEDTHTLSLTDFKEKLSSRTKVVALAHASNVLGYLVPLAEITSLAHAHGARVVIDATQTINRLPFDVREFDLDYAAVSGHKLYGPTGTGWLYGKADWLEAGEPLLVGGGTIEQVTREKATWREIPWRYEAGTPDVAGVVGLEAALQYVETIGLAAIWQHDQAITAYALNKLNAVPGLTLYGPKTAPARVSIFSFTLQVEGKMIHSHDVVSVASDHGVALRGGHHCAQPLLEYLGLPELTRASAGIYTTPADIDASIRALAAVQAVFIKKASH